MSSERRHRQHTWSWIPWPWSHHLLKVLSQATHCEHLRFLPPCRCQNILIKQEQLFSYCWQIQSHVIWTVKCTSHFSQADESDSEWSSVEKLPSLPAWMLSLWLGVRKHLKTTTNTYFRGCDWLYWGFKSPSAPSARNVLSPWDTLCQPQERHGPSQNKEWHNGQHLSIDMRCSCTLE